MKLFFLGAGYSAKAMAQTLAGEAEWMGGTSRRAERFGPIEQAGIAPFLFTGRGDDGTDLPLGEITHLVVSISPDETGDPTLDALEERIGHGMAKLRWIGYFSTIGVYGDADGGWVDETTPPEPSNDRGRWRIEAERRWTALGDRRDLPTAIMRLAGIYGPGRNPFVKLSEADARIVDKPGQVFNRIHRDDIGQASAMLARSETGGVWNFADDEPAAPADPIRHAAALMGVEAPEPVAFDEASMSAFAASMYKDNKRVSNAKLREAGYHFVHPTYRSALTAMWKDDRWRGAGALDAPRGAGTTKSR